MATYRQIRSYVNEQYGFKPNTAWIADVKELAGIAVRPAWNRKGKGRKNRCPPEKVNPIKAALKHFEMV
jgi:hypothetical protein